MLAWLEPGTHDDVTAYHERGGEEFLLSHTPDELDALDRRLLARLLAWLDQFCAEHLDPLAGTLA